MPENCTTVKKKKIDTTLVDTLYALSYGLHIRVNCKNYLFNLIRHTGDGTTFGPHGWAETWRNMKNASIKHVPTRKDQFLFSRHSNHNPRVSHTLTASIGFVLDGVWCRREHVLTLPLGSCNESYTVIFFLKKPIEEYSSETRLNRSIDNNTYKRECTFDSIPSANHCKIV